MPPDDQRSREWPKNVEVTTSQKVCDTDRQRMRSIDCVGIAGVGLIGGSIALALRRLGVRVVGYDVRQETVDRALEVKAIDIGGTEPTVLSAAQVVIVATPPEFVVQTVQTLLPYVKPDCVLVDTASVKVEIIQALATVLPPNIAWIGGHPMFGSAGRGIESARAEMIADAPFLLTPVASTKPDAIAMISALVRRLGMRPIEVDPHEHDRQMAMLSHLPYLISCALAQMPVLAEAAGPAFREMTRVAASPPELWRAILTQNRAAVIQALDGFMIQLLKLRSTEGAALEGELALAKAKRDEFTSVWTRAK